MKAIRPWPLVFFALVAAVLGWVVNALATNAGFPTLRFPWSALATMALMCLLSLGFGFAVYRSRTHRSTERIDPLLAARTLVLGQACAHAGALIAGWHLGVLAGQWVSAARFVASASVLGTLAALGGGAVMVIAGIVVEYLCRIPPEEGEGQDEPAG